MIHENGNSKFLIIVPLLLPLVILLSSCESPNVPFQIKHLIDRPGKQETEIISYESYPGLDNTEGNDDQDVEILIDKGYYIQIIINLNTDQVSRERVYDKIVEFYNLSPNKPEHTEYTAKCPLYETIPPGSKGIITIEWTERWAEGVINKGEKGEGDKLGAYEVFLGYVEPCSVIDTDTIP